MCTGIHLHVHLPAIYAYTYTNCHCNSHCNSYRDCHGDFHSHFHPNYDSTTNSDIYTYGYFDDYTQANPYAQAACNAEGTTHPAAAPVITGSVVRFRSGPGSPTPATVVEAFDHFLHAADHKREAVVIEFVGRVAR